MPAWVPAVAVPFVIAFTSLAAQFYFKWVPDVEEQKRHLRQARTWAADILGLALQAASLYALLQGKGPVTRGFVVGAALTVSCSFVCVLLIVFRRWFLEGFMERFLHNFERLMDQTGQHISVTGRHIEVTEQHKRALQLIATDPNLSRETVRELRAILLPPGDPASPLALVSDNSRLPE